MDSGPISRSFAIIVSGAWSAMVIVGVSACLLVIVNLGAYFLLKQSTNLSEDPVFDRTFVPDSQVGVDVLSRVFNAASEEEAFERLKMAPSLEMHPGLQFMTQRVNNKHYLIGVEGIRYETGWTDRTVRGYLASQRPLVFLMGGSTTLGHGVSHGETISSYLNRGPLGARAIVLNLGAQAYDLQRVVEKLAYLLRCGYRPKAVVILIGWNEIQLSARSNMRWQDKAFYHGVSTKRGEIAFTPGASDFSSLRLFAESLPLTRLVKARSRELDSAGIKQARDPFLSGFDFAEAHWVHHHWAQLVAQDLSRQEREFVESLANNLAFAEGLSRAFGFDLLVVFQPIGLFDDSNPFVTDGARKQPGFKFMGRLRQSARDNIVSGRLRMLDGSRLLDTLDGDRYIDVAHYSPHANAALAELIAERLKRVAALRPPVR